MKRLLGAIADYIRETDKILLGLCTALSLFGCVEVYSASRAFFGDGARQFWVQFISTMVGLAAAIFVSIIDYRKICRFWLPILIVCAGLIATTYFIGFNPGDSLVDNNRAWIRLPVGGLTLQPSEIVKIGFIISFAKHISWVTARADHIRPLGALALAAHGLAPVLLIHFVQGDDGTAVVFAGIFLFMMAAAGVKLRYFLIGGLLTAGIAPLIWYRVMNNYQRDRFRVILDWTLDPKTFGYQQLHARITVASGGLTGAGVLRGPHVQQPSFIPEGYNDFIFASTAEEWGFLGCVAVLAAVAGICVKILRNAAKALDTLGTMLCVGVFAEIAMQTVINVGMNLSVLPVIGVTMPFMSAGGTSIFCLYLGIGLATSVYMHRHERTIYLRGV